jgi:hypothetical protein
VKANELRIGNFLQGEKGIDVVSEINMDSYASTTGIRTFLQNAKPIPLSEDWIKKLGFTKSAPRVSRIISWHEETSEFYIRRVRSNFELLRDNYDGSVYIKRIQFVHQLQNLYFALTGNELEIEQ